MGGAVSTAYKDAPTAAVDVDGTSFAYRQLGADVGVPVILLNHMTGVLDDWDPRVVDGLAARRRVITFDNRGVGATPGRTPNSIAAMARDAIAFIRALGFAQVDLLGLSLGGFVAQEILQQEPELVRKLILAGTGPAGGRGIGKITTLVIRGVVKGALTFKDAKQYLFFTQTASGQLAARQFLEPARAFYGNQFGLTFPVFVHYGIQLWVPEVGGQVDPGSDAHELVMAMYGGMSKGERNRIKIRVRTAMASQASTQGRYLGGRPGRDQRLCRRRPHPWAVKNSCQVGPDRPGAGSTPAAFMISHTVDAPRVCPRPASSPWMRRYPQVGFSRASRLMRTRAPRVVEGRPGIRIRVVLQRRATRARCQPRIVAAVTSIPSRRAGGSARPEDRLAVVRVVDQSQ
jgi:pimeloyl-ACP methyl ester carboxylesterase